MCLLNCCGPILPLILGVLEWEVAPDFQSFDNDTGLHTRPQAYFETQIGTFLLIWVRDAIAAQASAIDDSR